jgi:hypothetical protein
MSDLPEPENLAELAAAAGRPPAATDDIDLLEAQCRAFIDRLGRGDASAMARTKLAEMTFWMRSQRQARPDG